MTLKNVIVGVIFLTLTATANAMDVPKFTKEVLNASVQIGDYCSGQIIQSEFRNGKAETLVMTAKHCLMTNPTEIRVIHKDDQGRTWGYTAYLAETHYGYASDFATLRLLNTTAIFPTVRLADPDALPPTGTSVYTVGYPLGHPLTITEGLFVGRDRLPGMSAEFFRGTPGTAPGNSGGGLYYLNPKTNRYELIGVTSMHYTRHDHVAFYVPIDQIRQQMKYLLPYPTE